MEGGQGVRGANRDNRPKMDENKGCRRGAPPLRTVFLVDVVEYEVHPAAAQCTQQPPSRQDTLNWALEFPQPIIVIDGANDDYGHPEANGQRCEMERRALCCYIHGSRRKKTTFVRGGGDTLWYDDGMTVALATGYNPAHPFARSTRVLSLSVGPVRSIRQRPGRTRLHAVNCQPKDYCCRGPYGHRGPVGICFFHGRAFSVDPEAQRADG